MLWANSSAHKKLVDICEIDYKGKLEEDSVAVGASAVTQQAQIVYGKCLIETDTP